MNAHVLQCSCGTPTSSLHDVCCPLFQGNALYPPPDTAPCLACSRDCTENEIDATEGYCPGCGARWVGIAERFQPSACTPVLATDETEIPF